MAVSKNITAAFAVIYILVAIQLLARKEKLQARECCPAHAGMDIALSCRSFTADPSAGNESSLTICVLPDLFP